MSDATPTTALLGVVLAGGRSRRMGHDKAALTLEGRTYLDRVCDVVAGVASEVVVLGATTAPVPAGATHVTDAMLGLPASGLGPGAAVRAFVSQRAHAILLVAADMPLIQPAALRWLIEQWVGADTGVVAELNGQLQPTAMIVTPSDVERTSSDDASPSLRSLCAAMTVRQWPVHLAPMLRNVNTPADREALHASVRP